MKYDDSSASIPHGERQTIHFGRGSIRGGRRGYAFNLHLAQLFPQRSVTSKRENNITTSTATAYYLDLRFDTVR